MSINYIQLTDKIKMMRGNFAPLYDASGYAPLYLTCLNAEKESLENPNQCFGELRRAMELTAIDLEAKHRKDTTEYNRPRADIVADIQSQMEDPSNTAVNAKKLIRDELNRMRQANSQQFYSKQNAIKNEYFSFLSNQKGERYLAKHQGYLNAENEPDEEERRKKRFKFSSLVFDLYDYFSDGPTHVDLTEDEELVEVGEGECNGILSLFYSLLRFLYGFQGTYTKRRCPLGEYYPVEPSLYGDLHLIFRGVGKNDIFVRDDGGKTAYYLLKDAGVLGAGNKKRDVSTLRALWKESLDSPDNILNLDGTAGKGKNQKQVLSFPSRPVALDDALLGKLSLSEKDEIALGMIKAVFSLHGMNPPVPHRALTPYAFYLCNVQGSWKPLLCSFETVKDLSADASFSVAANVKHYAQDARMRDYIAPGVLNKYADLLSCDIYSLGRLLTYLYSGSPFSDGKGVPPAKWELIRSMTDLDEENRPDIEQVRKRFGEDVSRGAQYALLSCRGKRPVNEDAFFVSGLDTCFGDEVRLAGAPGDPAMFAVFDGLGGAEAGEEVSRHAARTLRRYSRSFLIQQHHDYSAPLSELAVSLNEEVQQYKKDHSLEDSGTTMVLCLIRDGVLSFVNVGDSKLFLVRDGKMEQRSKDHCYPPVGGKKGALYQMLGMSDEETAIAPFTGSFPLEKGDLILLCSDGLTEAMTEEQILEDVMKPSPLDEKLAAIAEMDKKLELKDNTTVILYSGN